MRLTLTKDGDIGNPLAETNVADRPSEGEASKALDEIIEQAKASFEAQAAADKVLADKLAGEGG